MDDKYPIIIVNPEHRIDNEQMGSKRKFWFSENTTAPQWLFKYPRLGSGEHWAEKIAEQIALKLEIEHAEVELAVCEDEQGIISKDFTGKNSSMVHGNDFMSISDIEYDLHKKFKQSQHTVERIFKMLSNLDFTMTPYVRENSNQFKFTKYLLFDALITNTDRHHENWGVVIKHIDCENFSSYEAYIAPSYDHASSLGREFTDIKRDAIRRNNGVAKYIERGHGAIFWDEKQPAPSPLELIRLCASNFPNLFTSSFTILTRIKESDFEHIISRIPDDWMSQSARLFTNDLLCYNLAQLRTVQKNLPHL